MLSSENKDIIIIIIIIIIIGLQKGVWKKVESQGIVSEKSGYFDMYN